MLGLFFSERKDMKEALFVKAARWLACFVVTVLALGASLIGDYKTTIAGVLFALFLTFSAEELQQKLKGRVSYKVLLVFLLLMFLWMSVLGTKGAV